MKLLKTKVPTNFQSLPRELRQHVFSYAFNVLYHASYRRNSSYYGNDSNDKQCHAFWCLVWEIAEWLKGAFPDAKEDIEYIRVTWAGKPESSLLYEEEVRGLSVGK